MEQKAQKEEVVSCKNREKAGSRRLNLWLQYERHLLRLRRSDDRRKAKGRMCCC